MAFRLRYRYDVLNESIAELEIARDRYQTNWKRFNQHGYDMQTIVAFVADGDVDGAVELWNSLDQHEVDAAFRCVLGEREPIVHNGVNLATLVWREYDLEPVGVAHEYRDRKLKDSDSEDAWKRSVNGRCNGCGTPTISGKQRRLLHRLMKSTGSAFDLTPTYSQYSGVEATLWNNSVTIAVKGVADHIVPRSHGGRTDPGNLTNACTGCNNSRQHATLDSMGIQAYDRPHAELSWNDSDQTRLSCSAPVEQSVGL